MSILRQWKHRETQILSRGATTSVGGLGNAAEAQVAKGPDVGRTTVPDRNEARRESYRKRDAELGQGECNKAVLSRYGKDWLEGYVCSPQQGDARLDRSSQVEQEDQTALESRKKGWRNRREERNFVSRDRTIVKGERDGFLSPV
jgi:hypothetical protein